MFDLLPSLRSLPDYFDREERRLVFQSLVVGVVVWLIVFALKTAVHNLFHATLHWLESVPLLFVFLPLLGGALVVAAISSYRATVVHYREPDGHIHELIDVEGDGLERAIALYYTSEPALEQTLTGSEGVEVRWQMPTFSLAIRKFLATLVTIGSGGSGGLEASVTLIGESVSAGLFKPRDVLPQQAQEQGVFGRFLNWWRPNDPDDLQTAQLSGIAAAVATLLGAPFAAAFFATEIMYRKRPLIEKLVYALISALVAFFLNTIFDPAHATIFHVEQLYVPPLKSVGYYAILVLLAVAVSLMSVIFGNLRATLEHTFHHRFPNIWQRHLLGAAITATIAILIAYATQTAGLTDHGLELILGPGETLIDDALAGELVVSLAFIALLFKMLATVATVGSGGSAGLLVPSLFFGTMVATLFSGLFPTQVPMTLVIPAMTASLVAIANVPLAAILFTIEVFGTSYMLPALVVLVVTTLFAHDNSIYRTQREKVGKRQIMPGISVKRVAVPAAWAGQTLVDLDFRNRFDLNVIGLLEHTKQEGVSYALTDTAPTTPLETDDILVVMGSDEKIEALIEEIEGLG